MRVGGIWEAAAPLPGGRDLVAPLRGGRGFSTKFLQKFFAEKPLEDRSPDSGAAGPPGRPAAGQQAPTARQRGDRLPRPYIRGWLPPPPHLAH